MNNILFKFLTLLIVFVNISNPAFSQRNSGGIPLSFQNDIFKNLRSSTPSNLRSITRSNLRSGSSSNQLPYIDNAQQQQRADSIKNQSCPTCKSSYYGTGVDVSIDIKTEGQLQTLSDSTKIWLLTVESSTAYGMQFYFDKFKVPEGAKLFIYNEDKTMLLGAFTSDNNPQDQNKSIKFGTQHIMGKKIFLEYSEPAGVEFQGELSITKVIHIFSDKFSKTGQLGASGACNKNVVCPEGKGWENEINSVALIEEYDDNHDLGYYASGCLINNVANNGRPFFLTAKHNLGDVNFLPDTWVFIFNDQTTTCESNGSELVNAAAQSVYGANILAADGGESVSTGSPTSDYLLLELTGVDVNFLKSYNACYAGWTLNSAPSPSATGIHHPSGDVKKISIDQNAIQSTMSGSSTINANGNHWRVNWDIGTTEGGSSGSPLFDNEHKIVGQLHGGDAKCNGTANNGKPDWYGKFTTSWQNGGFDFWLDPDNTGQTSTSTFCPNGLPNTTGDNNNEPPPDNGCIYYPGVDEFTINGSYSTIACVAGDMGISIKPLNVDRCSGGWFLPSSTERQSCSSAPNSDWCHHVLFGVLGCDCYYVNYLITMTKIDDKFNPISVVGSKWFKQQISSGGDAPNDIGNEITINSGDLLEMGISSLDAGSKYKLTVGTYPGGGFREQYQYFQYLGSSSQSLSLSGNISSNQSSASSVIISNATISSSVDVASKTGINISNTTINAGSDCRIVPSNCNTIALLRNNLEENTTTIYSNYSYEKNKKADDIIATDGNINVYPNPNNGNFTLTVPNTDIKNIIISDVLGKTVYQKSNTIDQTFDIDISQFSKGVYFVKVEMGDKIKVTKIINH